MLYQRRLPFLLVSMNSEVHLPETGHFALEEDAPTIARLMLDFLDRRLAAR